MYFILLFIRSRLSSADLPTSGISSKRAKLAETSKDKAEGETVKGEKVWPEPQERVCPPVRAALILPDGVNCPEGGHRFSATEDLDPVTVSMIRSEALARHDLCFCTPPYSLQT